MPRDTDLIAEQLAYYRARAAEYDLTSYEASTRDRAVVPTIVDQLAPTGDVLELACGTGIWTVELARWATTLTAVDGSPEMLERAAARVAGKGIRLIQADLFDWTSPQDYDVVFFCAWLSHVPSELFAGFWEKVEAALRAGGRVLFVDESPNRSGHEVFVSDGVVSRALGDGTVHRVVKRFYEPGALAELLAGLGWTATVTALDNGWYVGEAKRVGRRP